ncbi:Twitchin [Dirofilaria immitis]
MNRSRTESGSKCNEIITDKKIALITLREKYRVKLQQFATYSLKIRKLLEIDRVPKYINLSAYDDKAVKILAKYIQNKDQKNITLSFYTLADLLDLSRSLLMLKLLKQLEQILVDLASQKTDALIQALIIVGNERSIFGGLMARQKIERIAAAKFQDIIRHKLFGFIPPIVFANIISRCDLNVEKEINAVDAGIVWIWQQEKPLISSALVFSRIRSAFLSRGDRNTIQNRLKTLPNGEKLIPFIMTILCSSFSHRCCVIKEHIDKRMVRCGVPNPSDDTTVDLRKLPLSGKLSIMQYWENKSKLKKSSKRSKKKRKIQKRKTKAEKVESDDKSRSPSKSSSKSDKSKTNESQKLDENVKNQSTRNIKREESGGNDSGKSKNDSSKSMEIPNANRKKLEGNKTDHDDK